MSHVGIPMQDQPASQPPRRSGHGPGIGAALVTLLALVGVVALVWFLWGRVFGGGYEDYEGQGTGSTEVVVEPGDSVTAIANTLADADVVASPQAFIEATSGDSRANSISPGAYLMRLQMSGAAAFELMLDPSSRVESQVVLPEGLRIDQTVQRTSEATGIPAEELLAVLRDPGLGLQLPDWAPNTGDLRAEGFLFPATYVFGKDATAVGVLQAYVDRFDEAEVTTGLGEADETARYSPYEVLIIASLVQAEGTPEDYGKVSRVIYNRLDPQTWGDTAGFLGIDATINYANAESELNISQDKLQQDGPYNTRTRQGLPPTPINSPGEEAIAAAMNPEPGDWLYYVTVNPDSGETKFTRDYNEFLGFKAEFEAWCSANPGQC